MANHVRVFEPSNICTSFFSEYRVFELSNRTIRACQICISCNYVKKNQVTFVESGERETRSKNNKLRRDIAMVMFSIAAAVLVVSLVCSCWNPLVDGEQQYNVGCLQAAVVPPWLRQSEKAWSRGRLEDFGSWV
ncbi:hypothetical protein Nepgr_014419 [Nepenthes gracilis]|uniref:Transmembrane protein n=1 Tax=Nepenthes gracilis TaxID=150966 RepID=A0AAD3SJZ6_NEPGR|nr:hypothetical protein Nepgr_014419 [Nepenthes gracilis]